MRALFWTVIQPQKIMGSIWEKMEDEKICINQVKFEDGFSQKKVAPKVEKEEKKEDKGPIKPTSQLPGPRQQNINIVMGKVKIKPPELKAALFSYDKKKLSSTMCELLIPILPNEGEIGTVNGFEGDHSLLPDCDQFVLLMESIPGYDLRMKTILFSITYNEEIKDLNVKIDEFFEVFKFFKSNSKFLDWLQIVLAHGNYLNGTGSK